jgi:hypothetical protein
VLRILHTAKHAWFHSGQGKGFHGSRIHLELNCAAGISRQGGIFLKKTENDYRPHHRTDEKLGLTVILPCDVHRAWLDPWIQDETLAIKMLRPFVANFMRRFPVSPLVNHVANDRPECCAAVDLPATTRSLFV